MGILKGKRVLITGLISNRSIAAGIAAAMHAEGAELAFSYVNERFRDRILDLAKEWNSTHIFPCDVQNDEEITSMFDALGKTWPEGFDILVHSIAYAPADQLNGDYLTCISREGFRVAHEVSAYSLAALAKTALPWMKDRQGSLLTLTYLGAERAIPNYNVMGLAKASLEANVRYLAVSLGQHGMRINAISAGPVKTLAAAGIAGFKEMLNEHKEHTPLKRNVTLEEIGHTAAFLCSSRASGITGQVVHVDAGYNITSGI
ncbi:MAG: enoyl-ACP reductase [Pseudomonadota bacterium]